MMRTKIVVCRQSTHTFTTDVSVFSDMEEINSVEMLNYFPGISSTEAFCSLSRLVSIKENSCCLCCSFLKLVYFLGGHLILKDNK